MLTHPTIIRAMRAQRTDLALLVLILLAAFALRVYYVNHDRFHADEALYAGWALRILDDDPLLRDEPVDKPPLYLYLLAGSMRILGRSEVAARFPNLAASMANVALLYRLVRRLYGRGTARWAAFLGACSPFAILFARTAFTDPLLVTWMLAVLCAIAGRPTAGRGVAAGLAAGLAFATKQHAVLLLPFPLALALARRLRWRWRAVGAAVGGLALPIALVIWWDAQRWAIRPGFWRQSAMSYGGLRWAPVDEWAARGAEWLGWARYLVGSPLLYGLLVLGGLAVLAHGCLGAWGRRRGREIRRRANADFGGLTDAAWIASGAAYLLAHTLLAFSLWDRYLLPLVPVTSTILARIVAGARSWARHSARVWARTGAHVVAAAVVFAALFSGVRAARNGYPVGGEHWAYQGLDEIAAYLEAHAAPDAVLYHHWLRWHYTYYLDGAPFELRWWGSAAHLEREAQRTPDREQYIVLPDWRDLEPESAGLRFELLLETHREDGSVSLRLFRVRVDG
jgi:4-amino-4-deoxy-L-arabinose transferase-like glycosyltransferase